MQDMKMADRFSKHENAGHKDDGPEIQGGPAKVRQTYIFDGNIWIHR